jgi:membrane fusion protein, multidrug efflux system
MARETRARSSRGRQTTSADPPPLAPLLVITLLPLLAAGGACSEVRSSPRVRGAAVPVAVAVAGRETVPVELVAIGAVEAYSTVNVKAQVGGELLRVAFAEGQMVRQGQLLFQIDPRPYRAALAAARARLAIDKAKAVRASLEAKRETRMVKDGTVSRSQLEETRANDEATRAALEADRADIDAAHLNLAHCTIRSPVTGRTGNLLVHPGDVIKANADGAMVVLRQLRPIYVTFSLPEKHVSELRARSRAADLPATIQVPGQADHVGKLSFIDNSVDPSTGTILLKALLPNDDEALWPGQFVDVALRLSQRHNAVVIPAHAVQPGQRGPFVYVVRPDRTAEPRDVVLGPEHRGRVVVDSGLVEGESIVTDGQIRLRPGSRVEARALDEEARGR